MKHWATYKYKSGPHTHPHTERPCAQRGKRRTCEGCQGITALPCVSFHSSTFALQKGVAPLLLLKVVPPPQLLFVKSRFSLRPAVLFNLSAPGLALQARIQARHGSLVTLIKTCTCGALTLNKPACVKNRYTLLNHFLLSEELLDSFPTARPKAAFGICTGRSASTSGPPAQQNTRPALGARRVLWGEKANAACQSGIRPTPPAAHANMG